MPRERYMTFVLTDPRAPEYPRYVGYGPASDPWELLWDFREFGTGRLYDWLRNLDAHGLGPLVVDLYCIGRSPWTRHSRNDAQNTAELIDHFIRHGAEERGDFSSCLLNDPQPAVRLRRQITATDENGKAIEYESISAAGRAGFSRSCIYDAMKRHRRYRGYLWQAEQSQNRQFPVDRVNKDGSIESFPSIAAAARATGVSRPWIVRLLQTAERDPSDARWRYSANPETQVKKVDLLQSFGYRILALVNPLTTEQADNLCHSESSAGWNATTAENHPAPKEHDRGTDWHNLPVSAKHHKTKESQKSSQFETAEIRRPEQQPCPDRHQAPVNRLP